MESMDEEVVGEGRDTEAVELARGVVETLASSEMNIHPRSERQHHVRALDSFLRNQSLAKLSPWRSRRIPYFCPARLPTKVPFPGLRSTPFFLFLEQWAILLLNVRNGKNLEAESKYIEIVEGVRRGDERAVVDLHRLFAERARPYVSQRLGPQDAEDRLHDSFIVVLRAIRNGKIKQPDHLMSYIFAVVRRQITRCTVFTSHRRTHQTALDENLMYPAAQHVDAEGSLMRDERCRNLRNLLACMRPRDRDVLTRFYLKGQAKEVVCEQMRLTATQFRLLKNRATIRFRSVVAGDIHSRLI